MHVYSLNDDSAPDGDEIARALREIRCTPITKLLPSAPSETEIAPVECAPDGGEHASSVTFSLRCATPNAQIRFALDADDVDENGTLYDAPQLLTQTTQIAARAWIDGRSGPLSVVSFVVKKALWEKREPIDRGDEVAHETSDAADLPDDWKLAAASVRGKLHAHRGAWREDSFAHATAGNWSLIAVADGAGSAALSRVGSRLAVETALQKAQGQLLDWPLSAVDETLLKERDLPILRAILTDSARAALQAIREEAERRTRPTAEFATTLLLVARTQWNGATLCAALQIGDGAIALLDANGEMSLLGVADHGAHSSETRFLTTSGIEAELDRRVMFSIKPDLRALALMTDGVSDDFFPENTRLKEVFAALLPRLEREENRGANLLDWLGYEKKGSSDDRTIVMVWK